MRIEAAGKTWIVEEEELTRGFWDRGDRFSGVTFRNVDFDADRLSVRWVLRPERLTPTLARELFEIAAVRTWRDPRDARVYHLQIEANTRPSGNASAPTPLEALRFQSEDVAVDAPWILGMPLGLASDGELMKLLDIALAGQEPGRLRAD